MKRTLSDADRLELQSRLEEILNIRLEDCPTVNHIDISKELTQLFSEYYESKNSFSDGIAQEREEETDDPEFKGVAYEKDIDHRALTQGFYKVFRFLATHVGWYLDTEIAAETGVYVPSVQRYRSYCRQPEFGSHIIERRRRAGCRIFEYRMIANQESKIWKKLVSSFPS